MFKLNDIMHISNHECLIMEMSHSKKDWY